MPYKHLQTWGVANVMIVRVNHGNNIDFRLTAVI